MSSPASNIIVEGTSPTGAAALPGSGAYFFRSPHSLRETAQSFLAGIGKFTAEQPQWIIIGILYFFVWYTPISTGGIKGDGPLAWGWPFWNSINFTLGFQLYVPIGVGLIIWSKRAALNTQWKRVVANFPEHHPKREGNLIPLTLGVLLIIFAHFVEVKGVGVFAAILIAFGIVYRIYGSVITRMLAVPFTIFLLMIPPPDSVVQLVCVPKALAVELKSASILLNLLHVHTIDAGVTLTVNGVPVSTPLSVNAGLNVAFAAAFISLVYCLCRRIAITNTLWMFLLTIFVALVANVFRVMMIALTFTPLPDVSSLLMSPPISWFQIGVAFGLSWLITRTRFKPIAVKVNAPLSVHHAVRLAGSGIETMALPLIGAGKVMRLFGKGWIWSERRLERLLKALTPKRKRRRRSGSSSNNSSSRRRK